MVKKAVIMAAGKGVRMMPLTNLVPKPLIDVNNKPFLYYGMRHLIDAGYTEIAIIVGYKSEKVKQFLADYGFKAHLIHQEEQLGTGHAIRLAREFAGKDNFIVAGGDNLWSVNDLITIGKDDDLNYIAAIEVSDPQRYGVLVTENTDGKNYLAKVVEKPKEFVGNLINTGLYKFTPEIFEALAKITRSARGEYELTDAITMLAGQRKVIVMKIKDYWLDLGKIEDIEKVANFLRKVQ